MKPKYAQFDGKLFETTVGRILFNDMLPADYPFVNEKSTARSSARIVDDFIIRYGIENVAADPRPHQDLRLQLCHLLRHDLGHR